MSKVTIQYAKMEQVADNSRKLSRELSRYAVTLDKRVLTALGALSGTDKKGHVASASGNLRQKIQELNARASSFSTLSDNVARLVKTAQDADAQVANSVKTIASSYIGTRSRFQSFFDWIFGAIFVDWANKHLIARAFANCAKSTINWLDGAVGRASDWFRYGGGKYLFQAVCSIPIEEKYNLVAEGNIEQETQEDDLAEYLKNHDPAQILAGYTFSARFLNDLGAVESYLYSLRNWKLASVSVLGWLFSGEETAVDMFLNDPAKCNAMLRSMIDQMANTEVDLLGDDEAILKGLKGLSGFANNVSSEVVDKRLLEMLDGNEDLLDMLKNFVKGYVKENGLDKEMEKVLLAGCVNNKALTAQTVISGIAKGAKIVDLASIVGEGFVHLLSDYGRNIAILESLRELAPNNGTLQKNIDGLLFEYKTKVGGDIVGAIGKMIDKKIIKGIDAALGSKIGLVDSGIQLLLGSESNLNAIDTVLFSSELRFDAIASLRRASEKIRSGGYTDADVIQYKNAFELTRALTIEQYEAMQTYYKDKHKVKEAGYLASQIELLKDMTLTNVSSATPFSSYSVTSQDRLNYGYRYRPGIDGPIGYTPPGVDIIF